VRTVKGTGENVEEETKPCIFFIAVGTFPVVIEIYRLFTVLIRAEEVKILYLPCENEKWKKKGNGRDGKAPIIPGEGKVRRGAFVVLYGNSSCEIEND
jgi:hypothetical protein